MAPPGDHERGNLEAHKEHPELGDPALVLQGLETGGETLDLLDSVVPHAHLPDIRVHLQEIRDVRALERQGHILNRRLQA